MAAMLRVLSPSAPSSHLRHRHTKAFSQALRLIEAGESDTEEDRGDERLVERLARCFDVASNGRSGCRQTKRGELGGGGGMDVRGWLRRSGGRTAWTPAGGKSYLPQLLTSHSLPPASYTEQKILTSQPGASPSSCRLHLISKIELYTNHPPHRERGMGEGRGQVVLTFWSTGGK